MDKHRKEELKKNDLADVIENKLESLKPYSGAIGVGALLVVGVVGMIVWTIVSKQEKNDQQWADVYSANYSAQWGENPSSTLLDNTAADPALDGTVQGMWAKQLAADFHMNQGCALVQTDREKGFKKIEFARELFKSVATQADMTKYPLLWSRSNYGWARAAEASGDFEAAKEAYTNLSQQTPETPLGKVASASLKRVSNEKSNSRAFLAEFRKREPASPPKIEEAAPGSDTQLPARWDFGYPEAKIPDAASLETETVPAEANTSPDSGDEPSPAPPAVEEAEKSEGTAPDSSDE